MTWGLMQTGAATPAPPTSPFSRMTIERDGYGYSGGYKKTNHNAALSALALISFLFFLNLLQQQLSSGQQQTLLFMVNNTGRRKRDAPVTEKPAVKSKELNFKKAEAFQKDFMKKYLAEEEDAVRGSTSPRQEPYSPPPVPAPPTVEWQQLAAWMKGLLPAKKLPSHLAQVLSDCRDIVACTLHKHTGAQTEPFLDDTVVRAILAAAEDLGDLGTMGLDEACEDLMEMASSDCAELAHTFTTLLPHLSRTQRHLKHDPHD